MCSYFSIRESHEDINRDIFEEIIKLNALSIDQVKHRPYNLLLPDGYVVRRLPDFVSHQTLIGFQKYLYK